MKNLNLYYWLSTCIFSAFMLLSGVPDLLKVPEAIAFITALGYPVYFVSFIGLAKIAGSIAILIPKLKLIKEWAYAGLFFDLIAATYSMAMVKGINPEMLFMVIPISVLFISRHLGHKKYNTYQ